ncbi:arginine--tRNA ligase [Hamiltosporidium tvaerminnensis]|uniref:arginine--tRNA ligase n=1 Tax=Hamiltosporidium tvaerminnensis TaxID=1176355 RepID=A0A4Q9L4M6_9MICR|nr:arginine--tRNA ligase [Hamiltosporidium tvaerminnensis]
MDIDEIREKIVEKFTSSSLYTAEEISNCLEINRGPKGGDFYLQLARISKNVSRDYQELINFIIKNPSPLILSVSVLDNALAIKINKFSVLKQLCKNIFEKNDSFGKQDLGKNKKIIVEYSSPNIAKIFHAGHLRSTILGNFIKNIFKMFNYQVISINYLGDWGKQFGLIGVALDKYKNEEDLKKNPVRYLYDLYVRINKEAEDEPEIHEKAKQYFLELENGNEEKIKTWKELRELSIEKYKELYKILNIHFDVFEGESMFGEIGKEIIEKTDKLVCDVDGSKYFDLGVLGKYIVIKKDGSTLYSSRDIGAATSRLKKYDAEKIIYVVASQQDMHFKQLFKTMECLGYSTDNFLHINYGLVEGMSTRKGTVVFLEDIIDEAKAAMYEAMQRNQEKFLKIENPEFTTNTLAVSAIIIQDFSAKRVKNYKFDMTRNTTTEGETGPYLQYTHCRLVSIENKNKNLNFKDLTEIDFDLIKEESVAELVYNLSTYPYVLRESLEHFEPCKIVTYLMKISKMINTLFMTLKVYGQPENIAKARLSVFLISRIVLNSGMKVLGLIPLSRM